MSAVEIDAERLLDDLQTLRQFGACGTGVVRPALSDADIAARDWLRGRMAEAGLDATIDGVGNVIGRWPRGGRALLLGSHSDSQPEGGWLDGALGVIYALEVARALAEADDTRDYGIDVAAWMDEEGFYQHFVGSAAFCHGVEGEALNALRAPDGSGFGERLRHAGYAGRAIARLDRERHTGYLEAHIEQGAVLESERKQIGVVDSIVGIRQFRIVAGGQQNHAGTTPMRLRRDAGRAALHLAVALDAAFAEAASADSVWTFGDLQMHPGAASIVPGRAELLVQFRDSSPVVLDGMEAAMRRSIETAPCREVIEVAIDAEVARIPPAAMNIGMRDTLAAAAEHMVPGRWMHMLSGAGHDAQVFAPLIPTGMLFIPSIGGVSHSFAEDTADDDIVVGAQVLARAVERLLQR